METNSFGDLFATNLPAKIGLLWLLASKQFAQSSPEVFFKLLDALLTQKKKKEKKEEFRPE